MHSMVCGRRRRRRRRSGVSRREKRRDEERTSEARVYENVIAIIPGSAQPSLSRAPSHGESAAGLCGVFLGRRGKKTVETNNK
jgi:hypothetical protein